MGPKSENRQPRLNQARVVAVAVILSIPAVGMASLRLGDAPISGLRIEGMETSDHGDRQEMIRAYAESWLDTPITIDGATVVVHATRRELGASVDVSSMQEAAWQAGRSWNPLRSLDERSRAEAGELDLPFTVRIDADTLRRWITELQPRIERTPVPSVARSGGEVIPGIPGVSLSLIDSSARLRRAVLQRELYVQLPVMSLDPPQRSPVSLGQARFTEVVGAYDTTYAPRAGGGRSRNIERAAELLHGAVIAPGGTLSFNDRVGERSEARGFHGAIELRSGRRVQGVGGGVCQVAATLFSAAFLAGFDIVEHHPHSRNLGYAQPGLDAAVVWSRKDLIIRNPYSQFVRVHVYTEGRSLRVQLFGERPAPPVEWRADVLEEIPPSEERVVNNELGPGEVRVVDEGETGLVIEVSRTIRAESGVRSDLRRVRYPAASRLIEVGPS